MEKWVDIVGFEGKYQISNHGRVKSLDRMSDYVRNGKTSKTFRKGGIMKLFPNSKGYYRANLYDDKKHNRLLVHRLVAQHFIPNIEDKPQVNHIDGNHTNNHVSNLEWCTAKENMRHGWDLGLMTSIKGEDHRDAKLTEEDVKYIRDNYVRYSVEFGSTALGKKFGVHKQTILNIVKRKKWKHI